MQSRLKLKPGRKGAKKPVELSRPRPACVRYRYDEEAGKRYKTVEPIVEESGDSPSQPNISPETIIGVRIGLQEIAWRREIKLPQRQVEPRTAAMEALSIWGLRIEST